MSCEDNPWKGANLDKFIYYCCPECDTRDQSKEQFLKHAIDEHTKAKEIFLNVTVKLENFENLENFDHIKCSPDISYIAGTEHIEIKSELKEEYEENIDIFNSDPTDYQESNYDSEENPIKEKLLIENDLTDKITNVEKAKSSVNKILKKSVKCKLCDNKFDKPSVYISHLNNEHDGISKYHCIFSCNNSFLELNELVEHLKKIHGDLKHKCDYCEYKYFNEIRTLSNHIRKHHPSNYAHWSR